MYEYFIDVARCFFVAVDHDNPKDINIEILIKNGIKAGINEGIKMSEKEEFTKHHEDWINILQTEFSKKIVQTEFSKKIVTNTQLLNKLGNPILNKIGISGNAQNTRKQNVLINGTLPNGVVRLRPTSALPSINTTPIPSKIP